MACVTQVAAERGNCPMSTQELVAKKNYLTQLDLITISRAMCADSYPLPRWNTELITQCELLYKRFLWLNVKYPDQRLVPTREIDEFWHNHILHTRQYSQNCLALFGHYLHHSPTDGSNLTQLAEQFVTTKRLYQNEFNEPLKVII